jgi:hypothetical protein
MIIFSHPTGNTFSRAALSSMLEAGLLKEFHTTVAAFPGNLWHHLGGTQIGRELRRREFDARLSGITVQHPLREMGRILGGRLGAKSLTRHENGVFSTDAVYRSLDKEVARRIRSNPERLRGHMRSKTEHWKRSVPLPTTGYTAITICRSRITRSCSGCLVKRPDAYRTGSRPSEEPGTPRRNWTVRPKSSRWLKS